MTREAAAGGLLPYLDVPFQHASPRILRLMKRPAAPERVLDRVRAWRAEQPAITLRSTFIVGFPGESEAEFEELLAFLREAQLDRVGCFAYSPVQGAAANALADPVPEPLKEERRARFMAVQADVSAARLRAKVGRTLDVLVDAVDGATAVARSCADAPEIDGVVHVDDGAHLAPGQFARVRITAADAHDLRGSASPRARDGARPRDSALR
jgi:ribosomal protein S12 methylthiotransferase